MESSFPAKRIRSTHRPRVGKSISHLGNHKKFCFNGASEFGDRTRRGGKDEAGKVSRVPITKGLISHSKSLDFS